MLFHVFNSLTLEMRRTYISPVSPLYLAYISRASRLRAVLAQLLPRPLERVETRLRDMGEIWARYTRDRWEI